MLMFKIYAHTKREMCIKPNVCIQNQQYHGIKFTHTFFPLIHPFQIHRDNVIIFSSVTLNLQLKITFYAKLNFVSVFYV